MFSTLNSALRNWAEKDGRGYPDWATRYVPVVKALQQRKKLEGRILEIGANANGLARFIGREVIAIDLAVDHLHEARASQPVEAVGGDITQLPFPDNSFDAIICMDTFEHIPANLREYAALEILRVLKHDGTAVVTFPSGDASSAAEQRVRKAYSDFSGGATLKWLEEHDTEGLPDPKSIEGYFLQGAMDAYTTTITGNCNLRIWEWMWKVLMCGWPGRANGIAQALLRMLTPLLTHAHWGTCYRAVIWIDPAEHAP